MIKPIILILFLSVSVWPIEKICATDTSKMIQLKCKDESIHVNTMTLRCDQDNDSIKNVKLDSISHVEKVIKWHRRIPLFVLGGIGTLFGVIGLLFLALRFGGD
jgi:hypothetical protein